MRSATYNLEADYWPRDYLLEAGIEHVLIKVMTQTVATVVIRSFLVEQTFVFQVQNKCDCSVWR